jgi:AcrR family transcriptional regulator
VITRAEQKADTAKRVLSAARYLFRQRGYERVGIRDIAAEIGMSTGAVFNCFENKEELFKAVFGKPAPEAAHVAEFLSRAVNSGLLTEDLAAEARALRLHLIGRAK